MDPTLQMYNFWQLPLPLVLGFDFSGTVVAVGSDDDIPPHCDSNVVVGSDVFGWGRSGACFAEFLVAKRMNVALRRSTPAADASTYGIAFGTAYESVEVTGGVSARMRVIGSTSKPQGAELLRSLGVDHVIDYSKQDVVAEVLSLTGGRGADLVYDPTYQPSSFMQSVGTVASRDVWMKLGLSSDGVAEAMAPCRGRRRRGRRS